MRHPFARLGPYVAAAAGIVGFGLLYRGLAAGSVPAILTGLALILIGLDRAGRALAASMMMRSGGRPAAGPPVQANVGPSGATPPASPGEGQAPAR